MCSGLSNTNVLLVQLFDNLSCIRMPPFHYWLVLSPTLCLSQAQVRYSKHGALCLAEQSAEGGKKAEVWLAYDRYAGGSLFKLTFVSRLSKRCETDFDA